MATLKLLKLPKKPKASASASVLERYIAKVNEIKKENIKRMALNKKTEALRKKVAGINASSIYSNKK